jgi:hypothetical protein
MFNKYIKCTTFYLECQTILTPPPSPIRDQKHQPDNLKELNDKFGPYSTISARKESFWKALFSSEEEKK